MTTANKIAEIISNKLCVEIDTVTPDVNIKDDLGADSLDVIEIIMDIEKEFSIDIPDHTYESVVTVGDIISEVEKILAQ